MHDNLQIVGDSIVDLETGVYIHCGGNFMYMDDDYFHMMWECYMEYLDMVMTKDFE